MFFPFSPSSGQESILWQSTDGLMVSGMGSLAGKSFYYSSLGPRPITLKEVVALRQTLESQFFGDFFESPHKSPKSKKPILFISACPGFLPDAQSESAGLVFEVAHFRNRQQQCRDFDIPILSITHEVLVGGIHMMHGFLASTRLITPDTQIYGALPPELSQSILKGGEHPQVKQEEALRLALELDIVTHSVAFDELNTWVEQWLLEL